VKGTLREFPHILFRNQLKIAALKIIGNKARGLGILSCLGEIAIGLGLLMFPVCPDQEINYESSRK
jgi:hypothetical protein